MVPTLEKGKPHRISHYLPVRRESDRFPIAYNPGLQDNDYSRIDRNEAAIDIHISEEGGYGQVDCRQEARIRTTR